MIPTAADPVVAAAGNTLGTSSLMRWVRSRNSGSTALITVTAPTKPTMRATQNGVRKRSQRRAHIRRTPCPVATHAHSARSGQYGE